MSDFSLSWELSRKRFLDEIDGLTADQLRWKPYPGSLSIGEMALHVAGVEIHFASQLAGLSVDDFGSNLKRCATEGVVNDGPFPFADEQINPEMVSEALAFSWSLAGPLITEASPEVRGRELKSALGPMISGEGAFARLGFHAAYHQGQTYLMKNDPRFPG